LQGTANLAVSDGTVKGFDLPAVSEGLKKVNDPFDLFVLGKLFNTGESKFASLRGTFEVDGGQVRTEDLTLVALTGAGSASAVANLPHWALDAKAEFILTDLKNSPPITVKFDGPLDDPRAAVDANALRQWVVRRGLGRKEPEKPIPVAATPKPDPEIEAPPAAPKAEAKAEAKPVAAAPAGPMPPHPADGKALTKGLLDGLKP